MMLPARLTTASFSTAGSYVLQLTADDGELVRSDTLTITVDPAGSATLDIFIGASSDDAEESASGAISLSSSDLEMVQESTTQTVGLRFDAVAVPAGMTTAGCFSTS